MTEYTQKTNAIKRETIKQIIQSKKHATFAPKTKFSLLSNIYA